MKSKAIVSLALGVSSFISPAFAIVLGRAFLLPVYSPRRNRSRLLFGAAVVAGTAGCLWFNHGHMSSLLFNHFGIGQAAVQVAAQTQH